MASPARTALRLVRHTPDKDRCGGLVSELDDFVSQTVERHSGATTGVRNGDPSSFIEQLSTHDPVTLFPASQPSQIGWADVSHAVEFEVVAAGLSGDLAYLVGYESAAFSIEGGVDE